MTIIGIDPGPEFSALVEWDGEKVINMRYDVNAWILNSLALQRKSVIGIEQIRGYGLPAGNSTFDTCEWVGKFELQALQCKHTVYKIPRADVLTHFNVPRKGSDRWLKEKLVDEYPTTFKQAKRNKSGSLLVKGWTDHHLSAFAIAIVAGCKK